MRNLTWLAWIPMAACTVGTPGEEGGVFRFYQPTEYPGDAFGDRDLDDPIALGGRVDVAVLGWDEAADGAPTWSIEEGDALVVEEAAAVVSLRAVAEGPARVRVTAPDGSTDVVTLNVEPLGSSLVVVDEGLAWEGDVAPASVTTAGRTLRPGAPITLGASLLAADGRRMSGYDFLAWEVDEAQLDSAPATDLVNAVTVTALGEAGDTAVTVEGGGAMDLGLQDGTEANTLRLFAPEVGDDGSVADLAEITGEAGLILVGLGAFDTAGRFVVAGPDDALSAEISAGPATALVSADYDAALDGVALVMCPGEGVLELQFLGGVITAPFAVVTSDAQPATCSE